MPRALALAMRVVDGGMIAYWAAAALACAGLIVLPPGLMYDGYGTALIDAWNWSFAPLDLAFALSGLASLHLAARGDPRWRALALVSFAFTFCAGLMAISFWAFSGSFDAVWWLANLALVAVGLWGIVRLTASRA